ncbi:hypothetical protein MVEN_01557700 [Mycena venus]|uniref:Uncharacterized protein n=1 Tax=Mycena venus TaxID=2733690 RepID=A0A8H6XS12_9AGAR|nr:hypothetical protein MVEN_01557700 [Mycena venus]
MAVLLDLSPELITVIVEYLAPSSQSLDNLCLVGNHNLLTLVRPHTWREINITLGDDEETSQALASRVHAFCADSAKAAAVRSLNITLVGPFDFHTDTPATWALYENLPGLVNVTHASVCCINSFDVLSTQPVFIKAVVQRLPALLSLSVDGCMDGFDEGFEDMAEHPVPPLKHLATRFCNHEGVGNVWGYCSNLQVVEMAGGLTDRFWEQNARLSSQEYIGAILNDRKSIEAGVYTILDSPRECDRPAVIESTTTLKLISDEPFDNSEAWFLMDYFGEREAPPASLKEFVLDLSISVGLFRPILFGVRSPVIERIGVIASVEENRWIPSEFDELLIEISQEDEGTFFAGFQSLTELLLPGHCTSPETLNLFPSLLAHAPVLQHLYFGATNSNADLPAAAMKYAEVIPTLRSVSWRNKSNFHVVRNDGVRLRETPYIAPIWQGWNGIGKWWEVEHAAK